MVTLSIDKTTDDGEGGQMSFEIKSSGLDPEERFMRKQKIRIMREVVDKLKPRYKELVVLRYFRELSYEEIATETKLPLGTVKAQLFRARAKLYELMQNKKGNNTGSWDHQKCRWTKDNGRLISTALATLTLEVYYRYLPK